MILFIVIGLGEGRIRRIKLMMPQICNTVRITMNQSNKFASA